MGVRHRWQEVGLVAAGGAAGTLSRFGVSEWVGPPGATGGFPWATLGINLVGALLLGALVAWITVRGSSERGQALRLLLGTGVLGGFTTYSLLAGDLAVELLDGRWGVALAYAACTLVGGTGASLIGLAAGRWLGLGRRMSASEAGDEG